MTATVSAAVPLHQEGRVVIFLLLFSFFRERLQGPQSTAASGSATPGVGPFVHRSDALLGWEGQTEGGVRVFDFNQLQ